jgi:hypothetical protein
MLRRLSRHIRQNAVAWLALFVALGGTGAYAANTIGTGDIIDDQVTSADVRDDTLVFGGLAAQDLGPGSVRSSEVLDNSLTGTDINEATLNLPPTTTATFAGQGNVQVSSSFTKIVGKTLPAGSYAIAATANIRTAQSSDTTSRDTVCELRNTSGAFIGGGGDRRPAEVGTHSTISLSMNGGVQVPAGGGEVGLYCRYQAAGIQTGDGQMMIIRLDGFF